MKLTRYQRVADALLRTQGTTLQIFVLDQADEGVPAELVARKLADRTDGAVAVSGQAVRDWTKQFRADEKEPVA